MPAELKHCPAGPVKLAFAGMVDALEFTEAFVASGERGFYCFCEASLLSNVIRNEDIRKYLEKATAVFPDGVALTTLARIHGHRLPGRVPGPSFLPAACQYGLSRGWRHFFYGGAPGVAEKLAESLIAKHPGLIVAGTCSPPFRQSTPEEESATKQMIEAARPHLLWVCLGSPKQEQWCADHVGLIDVPLMLPVGAAFDFHSGHRPWAPAWIRKVGMEWAFRALTGGRRTFFRNLRCVSVVGAYLASEALKRCLFRRSGQAAYGSSVDSK